ncbi:MAG: ATP-dependent DNA helicase [Gammaproteobacteria bacterium]|nr:ATP-dependent DNA helicase [Gammaproteobacteria bacterium]
MRISVKELAEFVHRRGDIRYHEQSATLAAEGIARQKSYQANCDEGYLREHRVSASFGELAISGRIDGWDPAARLVEEIKTTRNDPTELHAHAGDVHEAQLRLYGAMLVLADAALIEVRLRLVYLHPMRPDETVFEETAGRDDLIGYFEATCATYAAWIANVRARLGDRNRQLAGLGFPYGEFRTDQRRIAKHLYRGFRDGADWLVEAPTGSGKTMASLFAALKAMGESKLDRLVFLTSRTTGQRAIEEALVDAVRLVDSESALTAVTVTAKDRICFGDGTPCDRTECRFARRYYERMPAARRQLLGRRLIRRGEVEVIAREHEVCPFELSLDVAAWADVVVCDYNYVFDPIVRLTRLENALFAKVGLIVDEAHQLGDRVRDMLGSSLARRAMKEALAESGMPEPLAQGVRSVDRALAAIGRESADDECEIPRPDALLRAIERLLGAALEVDADRERFPATAAASFEAFQFGYLAQDADDGTHRYICRGAGRDLIVELVCTVPGNHIRECMSGFHGSARVSGSLTPASVFQQIHGVSDSGDVLISDGCFPREHFGVFVVTDISTYYRDRDRTLGRVANLIQGVCTQTTGNYLVALPSFEYAQTASSAVQGIDIRCQQPGMTLDDREDFIRWISEPQAGRVGFVVMGGVFGESVDFRDGALDGIVVVGAGLPPRSLRRDLIAHDEVAAGRAVDGDEIAYRQPAMTRVVQAAGRVVRSASERGVAVLVDPRFSNAAYRAFLPSRWMTRNLRSNQVADALGEFWFGDRETRANAREAAC